MFVTRRRKSRKGRPRKARESLRWQYHNLMFKNDDRIQVMDFSQENGTEMSQEYLQWRGKNQPSREEKVGLLEYWRQSLRHIEMSRKWRKSISWINISYFIFFNQKIPLSNTSVKHKKCCSAPTHFCRAFLSSTHSKMKANIKIVPDT